jgi:hypothetical protein
MVQKSTKSWTYYSKMTLRSSKNGGFNDICSEAKTPSPKLQPMECRTATRGCSNFHEKNVHFGHMKKLDSSIGQEHGKKVSLKNIFCTKKFFFFFLIISVQVGNWTKVNQEADQGQEAEVITQEQDLGELVTQSTIMWSSTSRLLCHGDKIPDQNMSRG